MKIYILILVMLLSSCASTPAHVNVPCNKAADRVAELNLQIRQIDIFLLRVVKDARTPLEKKSSVEQDFYLALLICGAKDVEPKIKERVKLVEQLFEETSRLRNVCK